MAKRAKLPLGFNLSIFKSSTAKTEDILNGLLGSKALTAPLGIDKFRYSHIFMKTDSLQLSNLILSRRYLKVALLAIILFVVNLEQRPGDLKKEYQL